jgi:phosphoserine aminotransferase
MWSYFYVYQVVHQTNSGLRYFLLALNPKSSLKFTPQIPSPLEKIFFTPGPAQLYPTVEKHLASGLRNHLGSISHRGKQFQQIFAETTQNLRQLLSLPDDFGIYFTGSATEIWEKSLSSCVEKSSFHFVNGSFSKKYYEFAKEMGLNSYKAESPMGEGFDLSKIEIPKEVEVICCTQNETSTGVQMPVSDIHALKERYSDKLVFVDAVSSTPHPRFDWTKVDSMLFSVQKAMGMPAGLAVWIANPNTIEKAKALKEKGHKATPYHNLLQLVEIGAKNETPATPNVLYIHLLGKIAGDMLAKGVENIRQETTLKAKMLYDFCEESSQFSAFVQKKEHRSETVIVANTAKPSSEIIDAVKKENMVLGAGYGSLKDKQVRIANFPAVSVEDTKKLIEVLRRL